MNAGSATACRLCIAHPRLFRGMDLLWAPSIYFVQTGYSIYTLRQASRRSWRIGQRSKRLGRPFPNLQRDECRRRAFA